MTTTAHPRPSSDRALWVRVGEGLSVGNRNGNFLGTIERTTAGFVALDGRGEPAGLFPDEKSARRALTSTSGPALLRKRARLRRVQFASATGAGAVALTLALTAGALAPLI